MIGNKKEQTKTLENSKWSQNGATAARSRAHLSYWETVVFQREGGNWYVQIRHGGRRMKLSLGTPVKTAAVARARDFYLTLLDSGWEIALASLRPQTAPRSTSTVGDFLDEVKATADIDAAALEGYCIALRKIISDAFGIDGGKEKFDYRSGGRQRWLDRVHAIKLAALTPEVVQKWKRSFIARAGNDPVRIRSAKISCNSFLRRAKRLFAKDAIEHLSIRPSSPFEGVRFEKRQSMKYRSVINVEKLTRAARDELAFDDPASYLVFLLALGCGLRRLEIDRLEWSAFRWDENIVRIAPTRFFAPKTESSIGDIKIDAPLMAVFRSFADRAKSNFVIEVPNLLRKPVASEGYRAQVVFERLAAWLRSKGVNSNKPVHELRKEAGSIVNRRHGLTAASDFLRHADIQVTSAHYVDRARHATTGLGALLVAQEKIVPLDEPTTTDLAGKI